MDEWMGWMSTHDFRYGPSLQTTTNQPKQVWPGWKVSVTPPYVFEIVYVWVCMCWPFRHRIGLPHRAICAMMVWGRDGSRSHSSWTPGSFFFLLKVHIVSKY